MSPFDITSIFQWGIIFSIIGIFFLPLTTRIFSSFTDYGYIFSRIIGIALVSYAIFLLGILHIIPFTKISVLFVVICFAVINFIFDKGNILAIFSKKWRLFLFEELIFFAALFFWSYIRSHQPDIHGLEKYMDFGFINSILRSDYFPPRDMWFTPLPINYYYFGHLITAVLTKLSSMSSFITYNLMLSTLFALTFTGSFSIGMNLFYRFALIKKLIRADQLTKSVLIAGLLTAFLVTFAGNLHAIYTFFTPYQNENPVPVWQLAFSPQTFPNSYWYPNATRFIYNTIHEFPIYSFVVSDLHGHVLDIPFVLLTIAVLFSFMQNVILRVPEGSRYRLRFFAFQAQNDMFILLLLAFLLAVMYMTNAWDGIIYFLLTVFVIIFLGWKSFQKTTSSNTTNTTNIKYYKYLNIGLLIVLVSIGSILFSLPFSLNFKPFVSGVGVLCMPDFLTKISKIGPLLFEANHCQKSPLWQLFILYGFFYFWVGIFIVSLFKNLDFNHLNLIKNLKLKIKNLPASDLFIFILIVLSTLLIIIPEFIYIKDIYPAHYRANTMFKLVYESFIMLSIASGYIIIRLISNLESIYLKFVYLFICLFGFIGLFLVMVYPYFATYSYYGNLQTYYGLDGLKYLKNLYPTDYEAILWLNNNIKGQPVILEAQGDSYTDYARISANTGLPTVLGWTVHEWLWRETYDIPAPRIAEIQTLYESQNIVITKNLIKKYHIALVFIGSLEKQKYPKLFEEKFIKSGKIIYQNGTTRIYRLNSF